MIAAVMSKNIDKLKVKIMMPDIDKLPYIKLNGEAQAKQVMLNSAGLPLAVVPKLNEDELKYAPLSDSKPAEAKAAVSSEKIQKV